MLSSEATTEKIFWKLGVLGILKQKQLENK